jgi:hypothetical protein
MGVIQNIINMEIPRVCEINPGVPVEVESIASKALSKDREHRFQSAHEFRESIEEYLGIVRLNELTENLKILLERPTSTQVLYKAAVDSGRGPHKRSNGRLAALIAFVMLTAGSVAAMLNPSLLDRFGTQPSDGPTAIQAGLADDVTDGESYLIDLAATIEAGDRPLSAAADSNTTSRDTTTAAAAKTDRDKDPGAEASQTQTDPAHDAADNTATTTQATVKTVKPPERGWLSITAKPGAEIYVDGIYKGDTPPPMSLELSSGEHKVECKYPRYETYTEVVKIITGELSRRNVTLKQLKGMISLATQEGAELYVDGVLIGITPIMKPIEVGVGPHVLAIKKEGFYVWSSEVTVEPKKVLPLRITLSPRY